jgi:hypothetical protein
MGAAPARCHQRAISTWGGRKYFGRRSRFSSPEAALEAYIQKASRDDLGLTFVAFNGLRRDVESVPELHALLEGVGWMAIPADDELTAFVAYAADRLFMAAS